MAKTIKFNLICDNKPVRTIEGAEVSRLAAQCDEPVQRAKVTLQGTNCSLSGLENQCDRLLRQGKSPAYVCRFCLEAVGLTVLKMIAAARQEYPGLPVVCAGGVMSSDIIRRQVSRQAKDVWFVDGRFASDNAIGVAFIAGKAAENG